jgi:hypothetical protein
MEKQLPLFAYELTASTDHPRGADSAGAPVTRARRIVYVQQLST